MKVRDAVAKIKSGTLPATVLLYGEEGYIRSIGMQELKAAVPVSMPQVNVSAYDSRVSLSTLRDALAKPPFMSPNKIVLLDAADIFSSRGSAAVSTRIAAMDLADGTLFLIDGGEKPDRRKSGIRQLMKTSLVVECQPLKGDALTGYVVQLARKRGLHMSRTAAQSLTDRCGGDLFSVTTELDKLQYVCSGEITKEALDKFCRPAPEAGVFEIQDLFCAGHYEAARRAVENLLREDPSPVGFLSLTGNVLRQMLIARACRDAGYSEQKTVETVCSETGMRPWGAKRVYERCRHYSAAHLRRALSKVAQIDFGVKQGMYILADDLYAFLYEIWGMQA